MNISSAKLLELLDYNEDTGELRLKKSTKHRKPGWLATYKHKSGYLHVDIEGVIIPAHRVIWIMKTGEEPVSIDHINHIRDDNRWCNLRNISLREQHLNRGLSSNNTSGCVGVRMRSGRFCAFIKVHGKQIVLGTFDTLEDAVQARKEAERQHGFHANHGMSKVKAN